MLLGQRDNSFIFQWGPKFIHHQITFDLLVLPGGHHPFPGGLNIVVNKMMFAVLLNSM